MAESSMFLSAVNITCRAFPHNLWILFYKVADAAEYLAVLERLKASLSVALAHFYPLAGRLKGGGGPMACGRPHADQMGGRLYLECNDAGAKLVEAVVEGISFEQLQLFDFEDTQPLFTQLAPWVGLIMYSPLPYPSRIRDGALQPTTWRIVFDLNEVPKTGIYKLRIALASANAASIQVRVNDATTTTTPLLDTKELGGDNAIARHGIHGLYHLLSVDIPSQLLQLGENAVYLTQANTKSCLVGAMYDYLRLEEPEII